MRKQEWMWREKMDWWEGGGETERGRAKGEEGGGKSERGMKSREGSEKRDGSVEGGEG